MPVSTVLILDTSIEPRLKIKRKVSCKSFVNGVSSANLDMMATNINIKNTVNM